MGKLLLTLAAATLLCFGQAPAAPPSADVELPDPPGIYAIIETNLGRMIALLYDDVAPVTVKNFIDLAQGNKVTRNTRGKEVRRPYYDGLIFHRVIKGFMIQTGDVKGTGAGDCGIPTIPDEIGTKLSFDNPGSLGMANTGRPNSGSCQFFITVGRSNHLNGRHTIFGQVLEGFNVAVAISTVPVEGERPKTPVFIKTITIRTKR